MENRNGLIVDAKAWEANGRAERDALIMLEQVPGDGRITAGEDNCFDTRDFVPSAGTCNVDDNCYWSPIFSSRLEQRPI